jgi:protein-S-isoprenylcysteine O-methyltransferase Ste14
MKNRAALASLLRGIAGTLLVVIAFRWWASPLIATLDARWPMALPAPLRWLGGLLMLGALALIAAAEWTFLSFGGATGTPGDPPNQLVAHGPYRWLHNPLYLSGLTVLLGTALVSRSPTLLTLALIAPVAFHLFVLLVEEPRLEHRYGESYRVYKRAVPRWIPRRP